MAGLRVSALVVLAACGSADAQPAATSGLPTPAGWQSLPAVAKAVQVAAAAPGITVDGTEAWGEPAIGCYAIWIQLHGDGGGADQLTKEILDGLADAKIAATQQGADPLVLAIEKAPYKGTLKAELGGGKVTALACVVTDREPAACAPACKTLLGAMP
jgi:hypothetical protein